MSEYIYEICDVTDEDVYYPLGFFINKEEAINTLKSLVKNEEEQITDYAYEFEKIEIRERKVGMTGSSYNIIYKVTRDCVTTVDSDKCFWIKSIT